MSSTKEIIEKDKYFLPNVKRIFKDPLVVTEAEGAVVKDSDGKEYIDLLAAHGVNFLGHRHPKVVEAIKRQADKLLHYGTDVHTIPSAQLAEKLAKIAPGSLRRCYFASAGTEAVEAAFHLARRYSKKHEIVALYGAFHGRTYGSRSAVGWAKYKEGMGPYLKGIIHIPSYYCYRCSLGLEYPQCNLQCARMLEDALLYQSEGDVGAFIAEPIQGTAGTVIAPNGYFKEVKKILDSNGILFIDDEVFSGLGRTGKLFAIEHFGVEPDMMTLAKALGGGVSISAVIANDKVAVGFDEEVWLYYTTYGSNALNCAAAVASVDTIVEERLHERAQKLGEYFMKGLNELAAKHEIIGDVRGMGLMIGVELVKDRKTKEPARQESAALKNEARRRGLILPAGFGWLGNTIRMYPPVTITEEQIDRSLVIIDESLRAIGK